MYSICFLFYITDVLRIISRLSVVIFSRLYPLLFCRTCVFTNKTACENGWPLYLFYPLPPNLITISVRSVLNVIIFGVIATWYYYPSWKPAANQ